MREWELFVLCMSIVDAYRYTDKDRGLVSLAMVVSETTMLMRFLRERAIIQSLSGWGVCGRGLFEGPPSASCPSPTPPPTARAHQE